ncbi:MAG: VWA domain-containing protein [Pseudomonadota bacterium]
MTRLIAAFVIAIFGMGAAQAQSFDDTPDTILVLDASGSMWGQIDGVNKIVIARDVIAGVMADLPETLELGLMAYGHNRRGDCSDIEMLIPPGPDTRQAIVDAVNTINPRGRTPMSDAVVAAANALRHTENPATVILVSDGIETCEADPCAVAAELEAAGVGFTAHVIGFDVAAEPEARAQMQCLADTTGGAFLTADTAEELAAALTQVAVAPPAPAPANVTVTAIVAPGGTMPVSPLEWTLSQAGETRLGPVVAPGFVVELPAGDYSVDVLRQSQGTRHGTAFTVAAGETRDVVIELPALLTPVTFEARLDSPDGPLIEEPVLWSVGEISDTAGNPLETDLPAGAYSVEAYWTATEQVQSSQISILGADPRRIVLVFETPTPGATLIAPETAVAGSTIEVAWQGPDFDNDFIAVAEPDQGGNGINLTYTSDGSPLSLQMPPEPGFYEIRYVLSDGREVIARRSIEVTEVPASLIAPETAVAGATIEVAWQGPNYQNDFIAVAEPDQSGNGINLTYTANGSPLDLQMPTEPGSYEIRYVLSQDREVIARRSIEVTAVPASLESPTTAVAGETIEVIWQGPDYQNDFIAVAEPDQSGNGINLTYTADGSPLDLQMPAEPGSYEIRYVLSQDREVIARRAIEVTDVPASITAADSAIAGSTVDVTWTGPDYQNDFIAVAEPGTSGNGINLTFTTQGSPLGLLMPTEPGSYEIRYVLSQDRQVVAARMIEVTPVTATLTAPSTGVVGETIAVTWDGPDYDNDIIAVAEPGARGAGRNLSYTRDGSPLGLQLPSEPGTYEIRYVLNQDRVTIAAQQISVADLPPVTFDVPPQITAGSAMTFRHSGPSYGSDFIVIGLPGDDRGEARTFDIEDGAATITLPDTPGTYELRYIMNQDRRVLGMQEITVE